MNNDLISREALKSELTRLGWTEENGFKNRYVLDDIIDNAQAIPLPNEQVISDIPKDYLYDTETAEFYVYRNKYTGKEIHIVKNPPAYILDKRPKGEWIEEDNGKTTDLYRCSICGRSIMLCKNADLSKYPFCHCGADMRKGVTG